MKTNHPYWKIPAKIWLPILVFLVWTYINVLNARIFYPQQYASKSTFFIFAVTFLYHLGLLVIYFVVSKVCNVMYRQGWKWGRMIPVHLLLLPLLTIIQVLVYIWLTSKLAVLYHQPPEAIVFPMKEWLLANWALSTIFYSSVVGGSFALFNYRRFRQKEKLAGELQSLLATAQLQSLQAQLQPHFLFNVLNTISSYIYENPDMAIKIVARLSELLRLSLEIQHRDFMSLAREMTILEKYLEIEQLRFSDRLRVEIRVPAETRQALVPAFLLQPLVENALRHGIAGQIAGGTVEIIASRQGEGLNLQVLDNGAGAIGDWRDSSGIGLRNTRLRLQQLYGKDCRFHADNRSHGGFAVEVAIPFRLEQDERALPVDNK